MCFYLVPHVIWPAPPSHTLPSFDSGQTRLGWYPYLVYIGGVRIGKLCPIMRICGVSSGRGIFPPLMKHAPGHAGNTYTPLGSHIAFGPCRLVCVLVNVECLPV